MGEKMNLQKQRDRMSFRASLQRHVFTMLRQGNFGAGATFKF